jgi:predicted HTH transcriptional regulator
MVPTSLEGWAQERIVELLRQGVRESEHFDYKKMLPHKNSREDKERLKLACCAFANSSGGFLVFGVKNSSDGLAEARIVGLSASQDFPEQFGNYPADCEPSVHWAFKNPPIQLASGKVVHVVHILKSWNAPHCFELEGGARRFMKRTHKGNEDMSYEEIRLMFLQLYEKRLKFQFLRLELETIRFALTRHMPTPTPHKISPPGLVICNCGPARTGRK